MCGCRCRCRCRCNFTPLARYLNHAVPEEEEAGLPELWRRKTINGVDYFRDPTGTHVFNSRRLVVEFLRKTRYDLTDEELVGILEDSEEESDLSESEEESGEEGLLEEAAEEVEEEEQEGGSLEVQAFVEC